MGQAQRKKKRDIELWEINRDNQPRMMRLAEQEERQPGRKAGNPQPVQSARRTSGNSRPVHYSKRNRARRRKVYFYRLIALFVIVVCLVLI